MRARAGWMGGAVAAGLAAGLLFSPARGTQAQQRWAPPDLESGEKIETKADRMNFDRETGILDAAGNVVIRQGEIELRARAVRLNTETGDARAYGGVELRQGDQVWTGETLECNFKTKEGLTRGLRGSIGPIKVLAAETRRDAEGVFHLEDARVTTCTNPEGSEHYTVNASRMEATPDDKVTGHHTVWYFGPVPILYVPYWHRNLQEDIGFRFYPGHSSRMGTFLLSSYRYRINPYLKAETHLDYRTERGVAVGQDFAWWSPDYTQRGGFSAYYADDQEPLDDDDDPETSGIENDRYRFKLQHFAAMTGRDSLWLRGQYESDTDVREDFFEDDYRNERQPDNYVSYTHREDMFSVNGLVRSRLNDFYESVNRLPEVSLDVQRLPVGESMLYYEGRTAGAFLQRQYPKSDEAPEDYDAFRFDTLNTLYLPTRNFGFLNVIPRGGYRGTWYSDTIEQTTAFDTVLVQETRSSVDASGRTNTVVVTTGSTTNEVTTTREMGADLRSLFELGMETSFKAFKTFDGMGEPARHVVEPFANYTLIPEPDLTPDNLYQFDEVDELDEEHFIRLGARNKLQVKRDGSPFDLVDLLLYTDFLIHKEEDQESFEEAVADAELRVVEWMDLDFDLIWNIPDSELDSMNSEIIFRGGDVLRASVDYLYRVDDSNLVGADVTLFEKNPWAFNLYARYEFEESRLEEEGGYIQRNLDCMAIRLGGNFMPGYTRTDGTEQDDEFRVLAQFWLTAFPDFGVGGRHKN